MGDINNMPVIDLHLFRLGSSNTPFKKVLSFINNTASQFIEQMVNPNRFYTYAYLRKDRTPYYIGKGSAKRIYQNNGRYCNKPKDKSRIIFLKQNLTEEEAFRHEKYMIAVFGRKDLGTGILYNRTDGGEGSSGLVLSEETKKMMSEAKKGKSKTEEHRKKLSEVNRGKNNPFYGKTRTEESRKKQSESRKGKYAGENHPMYGKSPSEESRKKQSESLKGKNTDKKWWNDGFGNTVRSKKCPGDGWVSGRGKLDRKVNLW
jgi:hypothetical protein